MHFLYFFFFFFFVIFFFFLFLFFVFFFFFFFFFSLFVFVLLFFFFSFIIFSLSNIFTVFSYDTYHASHCIFLFDRGQGDYYHSISRWSWGRPASHQRHRCHWRQSRRSSFLRFKGNEDRYPHQQRGTFSTFLFSIKDFFLFCLLINYHYNGFFFALVTLVTLFPFYYFIADYIFFFGVTCSSFLLHRCH